jgi:VanZ family protein
MKKLAYFLPALIFYLLVYLLSSRDLGDRLSGGWLDKIPHVLEFAVLAFLLAVGFFNSLGASAQTNGAITFLTGLLLGLLDEYHQSFVPGRQSDFRDLLADAAGLVCGIFVYRYLMKRRERRVSR